MKAIILLPLLLTGCTFTRISDGQFTATRWTLGNKTTIGHLVAGRGTNSITLDQFSNDQVEAMRVATEAAVAGAVKGMKP